MLSTLVNYLRLVDAGLIIYLTLKLYSDKELVGLEEGSLQLGLTLLPTLLATQKLNVVQALFSLSLAYAAFPNPFRWVSAIFLLKIIYFNQITEEAINSIFNQHECTVCKVCNAASHFIRLTATQYLFLGIIIILYKSYCLGDPEPLPSNLVLFYQLIVTASTIGYGDFTPKSQFQIIFFIFLIPLVCASFVIYINHIVPYLQKLMVSLWGKKKEIRSAIIPENFLPQGSFTQQEVEDFRQFVNEVKVKNELQMQWKETYGYNWIIEASVNYQRQIPLINQILIGGENKQLKLKLCTLIQKEYFPKGWVVIKVDHIDPYMYMVDEGKLQTSKDCLIHQKGYVFNRLGFQRREASEQSYVTKTFLAVWKIRLQNLRTLESELPKAEVNYSRVQEWLKIFRFGSIS